MSNPPITRPMLAPPPEAAAYSETARIRSRRSRKAVISRASVDGAAIAAATPCTVRAVSSQVPFGESPPASEARVKTAMPAM